MSKILFFGFDQQYPLGGMGDLRRTWDCADEQVSYEDGVLSKQSMESFLSQDSAHERYQVVHLKPDGSVGAVEQWARTSLGYSEYGYEPTLRVTVQRVSGEVSFERYSVER